LGIEGIYKALIVQNYVQGFLLQLCKAMWYLSAFESWRTRCPDTEA